MTEPWDEWDDLLGCLDLRPLGGSSPDGAHGRVLFEGHNLRREYRQVFGAQILAQLVRAATLTCPDRVVASVHTVFPRPGRTVEPIRYEVRRHHQSRTATALAITAWQSHGALATASVSLRVPEDGPAHQIALPVPAVPGPEHTLQMGMLPWTVRAVADLDTRDAQPPEIDLWMRTPAVDPVLAPALTAYTTELTLVGTALRQIDGVTQLDVGTAFRSAVTAHTAWFHRPYRSDDWLLMHQHSPVIAHGRCFGRGDVLTAGGTLVASYAAEAMLRFHQPVSAA